MCNSQPENVKDVSLTFILKLFCSGSITHKQNVFATQMTPLFIRNDVEKRATSVFSKKKKAFLRSVQNTLISMRWHLRHKS